ncbi:MAG: ferritin family protein [Desulfobacterales bacterium]|nr:ferritin family protein [Desulfobacterales bacterium]MDJ0854664.1 ferritin family protein [Desulfobacterales bacterium]MDJ0885674.1 ferritin family protein [Desulfobacterales bacterium]MDJ0988380.1 ferritin family protein [Desulfobacterales bacterium]
MDSEKAVEILKQALLIEKKGKAFYSQVAGTAQHPEVKQFFETMAEEEVRHIEILSDQFRAYHENRRFASLNYDSDAGKSAVENVLTQDLVAAMQAADFESAAVSAAVAMEKNAIKLYGGRAAEATDPEEKALYEWLARWEKSHLSFLAELESELTQKVWFDQNFWPF